MFKMSPNGTRTELSSLSMATTTTCQGLHGPWSPLWSSLGASQKWVFKLGHWKLHHGRDHGSSYGQRPVRTSVVFTWTFPNFESLIPSTGKGLWTAPRFVVRTTTCDGVHGLHLVSTFFQLFFAFTLVQLHSRYHGPWWELRPVEPSVVFTWLFMLFIFARPITASLSRVQPRTTMKVTVREVDREFYFESSSFCSFFFHFLHKPDSAYTFNKPIK